MHAQNEEELRNLNAKLEQQVSACTATLEHAQRTNKALLDAIPGLMFRVRQSGEVLEYMAAPQAGLSTFPEQFSGKSIAGFFPSDLSAQTMVHVREAVDTGRVRVFGFQMEETDGGTSDFEARVVSSGVDEALVIVQASSDRRQAERARDESERQYHRLIELAREGIWAIDQDARTTFVNASMANMLGYTTEEMHRRPLLSFMDERGKAVAAQKLQQRQQGVSEQHEFEFMHKDGTPLHTLVATAPITDEDGTYLGAVAGVLDITARQQAEAALVASEAKFRRVFEASPMGIHLYELQDNDRLVFVDSNPSASAILGVDCARYVGLPIEEAFPPLAETEVPGRYRRAAAQGEAWHTEEILYRDDRISGAYEVHAFQTSPGKMAAMFLDLTVQRQAEEAIRRSEAQYRLLIETIPHGIQENDCTGLITLSNAAHSNMYGLAEGTMLGKTIWELLPSREERDGLRAYLAELVEKEPPPTPYIARVQTENRNLDVQVDWNYRRDEQGKVIGFVSVITDVTERRRAERDRERLIQKLEAKNAELERFAYTVSHDLKSPLVTIKGFLGLLEKDASEGQGEQFRQDIAQINHAADTMERLLRELLQLSRIGRESGPHESLSLTDLAREANALVLGQIDQRSVTVEIAEEMPVVLGDRVRLLEVFQNLLENAVKFMGDQADPRIEIGASEDASQFECYVRDNGMGIETRYHEQIFGLFDRLDPNREGTGIGLALVKRIVEVHGGRVRVESEGNGAGSTFYFTLPRDRSST